MAGPRSTERGFRRDSAPRRRPARLAGAVLLVAIALLPAIAPAADSPSATSAVAGLTGTHRTGQTFLVWTAPPGLGWVYRIYGGPAPITAPGDLAGAELLGSVGDSSWCDRRLSQLRHVTYGYAMDSLAAPLNPTKGAFVVTAATNRPVYYAVTTQQGAGPEDVSLVPGQNSLSVPVVESVGTPRPVYQRTLVSGGIVFDVYTLWTSHVDTPRFPAMASVPGLAFDCAVVRGSPGGALFLKPHARGGSFLNTLAGSGTPGEWRLTFDDHLYVSSDRNSFWYGYHEGYDPRRATNPTPVSGTVVDYTLRRIVHTAGWGRGWFPVDTTRVYASGGSMGGIGSLMLAFRVPEWIAAIQAVVPKFDFSYTTDPEPANAYNTGRPERMVIDHLWGGVAVNLTTSDGLSAYDRLNEGYLAGAMEAVSLPVIMAFNGKHDIVVGWGEKIAYYQAVQARRHGGYYFFDQRSHGASTYTPAWTTMQDPRYLYRFRTNRSYPALTNGSVDDNPGDGNAASGDSVGTINGFVEWDTVLVDDTDRWEVTLRTRSLNTLNGPLPGPDSLTVDVTPRRLQRLMVEPGGSFAWRVERLSNGVTVQSGGVTADALGLVTMPGVTVYDTGSRLTLESIAAAGVAPAPRPASTFLLRVTANPVRGQTRLAVTWPSAGRGVIELMDVAGRRIRTVFEGPVSAGPADIAFVAGPIASGRYYLKARCGSAVARAGVLVTN